MITTWPKPNLNNNLDLEKIYQMVKLILKISDRRGLHLATVFKAVDIAIYYLYTHSCREYEAIGLICLIISVKFYEANDGIDYEWKLSLLKKWLVRESEDFDYTINFLKRLEIHILLSIDWRIASFGDTYSFYVNIYKSLIRQNDINSKISNSWKKIINQYLLDMIIIPELYLYSPYFKSIAIICLITKLYDSEFKLNNDDINDIRDIIKIIKNIKILNNNFKNLIFNF
jgi:hypothetical protein